MRAAFIPALPPSALLAGMIAPSFRLVNRFCGKKLLRTCGRRERPPALCALFSRSPLACGRVPYPPYARCGMGRLCGERRRRERFERPSGARNAACSTRHRPPPGLPARTSRRVVWRGPQTPPSVFRIPGAFPKSSIWRRHPARARDRLPASSGRPASLTCAVDSAALRKQGYLTPAAARRSRRQSRRRSRRPAHPPAEKIGASRAFPPRS